MSKNTDWQSSLGALLQQMGPVEPEETPAPQPQKKEAVQRGRLTISFERKGRAGKSATIISGFTIPEEEVSALAAAMKKSLGTGGSARGGEILIQGDRREDIRNFLSGKGFKV